MRRIYTPLVQKVRGAQTTTAQLGEFAATLCTRATTSCRAYTRELVLACPHYVRSRRSYKAEEEFIYSGNAIEASWLVENIRWYKKRDAHFVQADEELPLIVNTAIRVGGLKWERVHDIRYFLKTSARIPSSAAIA